MSIPNLRLLISQNLDQQKLSKIRVNPQTQPSKESCVQKSPAHTTNNESSTATSSTAQPPTSSKDDDYVSPTSQHQPPTPSFQNNFSSSKVPIITSVSSLVGVGQSQSQQQQQAASSSSHAATSSSITSPSRQPMRRRIRRKGSTPDDQAEQLTEMSVRGLNLFRYASISEGVYKCVECAKDNVQKTFKNKYSFQRHAFLYHEGTQRKVFPCPMCGKEFSRPDKMKNHMKTTHECFVTKDASSAYPLNFLVGSGGELQTSVMQSGKNDNSDTAAQFAQHATLEYLRQQSAENSLQLQMIGLNSALSMQMPKLESLLPTTQ